MITFKYNVDTKQNLRYIIFSFMNDIHSWNLSRNDIKVFTAFHNKDVELKKTIDNHSDRMVIIFSKQIKDIIIKETALSYNTFNNSLSKLRKKQLINKNSLYSQLSFNVDKNEIDIKLKAK